MKENSEAQETQETQEKRDSDAEFELRQCELLAKADELLAEIQDICNRGSFTLSKWETDNRRIIYMVHRGPRERNHEKQVVLYASSCHLYQPDSVVARYMNIWKLTELRDEILGKVGM